MLDNVAAHWLLTEGKPGEVYNVGAGNELTKKELALQICQRMDVGDEMIEHVPDRPGHDLRYSVGSAMVRQLGWKPQHDLDAALDATIAWYRAQRSLVAPAEVSRRFGAPRDPGLTCGSC